MLHAASSRDRIREDYAQQQQTFQARHRHRLPRQLRRFAREFMELTECSSGSSGRKWVARRRLPFASCSCRHELDLPFSQGLGACCWRWLWRLQLSTFKAKILKYLRRKIIYLEFCSSCSILSCSSSTLLRFGIYEHDQTRSSHLYK